jgi:hypothetical protein
MGQGVHVDSSTAPTAPLYVPWGQLRHAVMLVASTAGLYVPCPHAVAPPLVQ